MSGNVINAIALLLLLIRIASSVLIFRVMRLQLELIRINNPSRLQTLRVLLFHLSIVVTVGNIIPILLDTATLFGFRAGWSVIVYAFSNDLTILAAATFIWLLYKIARKS